MENDENIIFLLGNQFSRDKDPEKIIVEELNLNCTFDEFLDALECKASSKKSRIVIFIDGLEDGEGIRFWNRRFNGFFGKISKRKYLGLILSIKNTYLNETSRDNPNKFNISQEAINKILFKEVTGFDDDYKSPIKLFQSNNINFIDNYFLMPEFDNPHFLKIYLEFLKHNNVDDFQNNLGKYCEIIDTYINVINKSLAHKFGYYGDNLVKEVLNALIRHNCKNLQLMRKDANKLILESLQLYPTFNFKFLDALIKEGILIEKSDEIKISFPIFEYYNIMEYLFENISLSELYDEFKKDTQLCDFIIKKGKIDLGFLEVFFSYIPEKYGIEAYELNDEFKSKKFIHAFLSSLKWRTNINKQKTIKFLKNYVLDDYTLLSKLLEELILLAPVEGHALNAHVLHELLIDMSLAKRDLIWTSLIDSCFNPEYKYINQIIEFTNINDYSTHSDEKILTISIFLIWLLVSNSFELRNKISASLINLLKNRMDLLLDLLKIFADVNDCQIYTRLYAVAYGCATLNHDKEKLDKLALYVYESIFNQGEVYPHILLRDYARNIIEYVINKDSDIENRIIMDKINPPYNSHFPDIPSNQEMNKLRSYGHYTENIFRLIKGEYKDNYYPRENFGCYVFTATFVAWKKCLLKDNIHISDLMNIAIKRTFELCNNLEKQFQADCSSRTVSNYYFKLFIKDKYIWFAYYELLAYICDRYPLSLEEFIDYQKTSKFDFPWNVHIRKFDPTLSNTNINHNINVLQFNDVYKEYHCDNKLNDVNEIPSFEKIILPNITLKNKSFNGILLEGNYNWTSASSDKSLTAKIRSYMISKEKYKKFIAFIKNKNLWENDFFESKEIYEVYNKEFDYSENLKRYYLHEKNKYPKVIETTNGNYCLEPVTVHPVPLEWSKSNKYYIKINPEIYDFSNLKYLMENSFLYNSDGEIAGFDTYELDDNHNLILDKDIILDYLSENEMEIVFAVEFIKNKNVYNGIYYFEDDELVGNLNPNSNELITDTSTLIHFNGFVKNLTLDEFSPLEFFFDEDNLITYTFLFNNISNKAFSNKKLIKKDQKFDNAICDIYFLSKENKVDDNYYDFVVENLGTYNDNYLIDIQTEDDDLILLVNSSKLNVTPNLKSKLFKKYIKPMLEQINYFEFSEDFEEPEEIWDYFERVWDNVERFD